MARVFASWLGEVTPTKNPHSLVCIEAASNHRTVISVAELGPLGSTGATAPIKLDWKQVTDHGDMTDDSANIVKWPPAPGETIQTKIYKLGGSTEPAGSANPLTGCTIHQQSARRWDAPHPFRELIVEGGNLYALRWRSAVYVPIQIALTIEE